MASDLAWKGTAWCSVLERRGSCAYNDPKLIACH